MVTWQNHLNDDGAQLIEIWDMDGYPVLSCIQKLGAYDVLLLASNPSACVAFLLTPSCITGVIIGAVLYYACSVCAVEKLRDPKFYCYEHWMQ